MSSHWFYKLAEGAQDGHWRRLPSQHQGKGPGGEKQYGRTWVRKNRLKSFVKLYDHQADFVSAVKKMKPSGGIVAAHGTGTGKTVSAIAAFEQLKGEGKAKRALVIVPAGLRDNFLNKGIKKFTDSKGVVVKKPSEVGQDVEYVVTSYTAFRQNPTGFIDTYKPDTIIADEFHRASNPGGKTHKALMEARKQVPRFIGLTASIVQNDPADIVPLMNIANRGEDTKKEFKQKYVRKQKVRNERGVFGGKNVYTRRIIRQDDLVKKLGTTIHYIEDLDADKKPVKDVQTVPVDMTDQQKRVYDLSMKGIDPKIRAKIAAGEPVSQKQAMHYFIRLLRARQVSNSLHTHVPNMTLAQAAEATPKVKRILDDAQEHIKTTSDAQIIMYTNFVHGGVDVLEAGLKARGVPYGVFKGTGKGVTNASRQKAVEDYTSGKIKVIIITGAGAEGLSLGNTTMVQMADGHYNPERMSQAEARGVRAKGLSHRPKEERRVIARRYVSTIPKSLWQKLTFRKGERSVGEWVHITAGRKENVNKELRKVLKRRSTHETKKRDSKLYSVLGGGP
tara:strand:+ start:525 stop:2204 length:1680 start_codon:yes stop_codon:yes gene_type:complete